MITGKALASGEATVLIAVRGTSGTARVDAMVDTGFNDDLTLPLWAIERLGLPFEETAYFTLAGGDKSQTRLFKAQLEWQGTWREVIVVEVEGDALIGMGAMQGCNLSIDIVDGGRVDIRPLPETSVNN